VVATGCDIMVLMYSTSGFKINIYIINNTFFVPAIFFQALKAVAMFLATATE
jgi:hypothetical protein